MTHPKRKRQTTPPSHAAPTQASKAKRVRFSLQGPLSCRPIDQPAEAPNEITAEELTQANVKEEKGEDGISDEIVVVQPNYNGGGSEEPTPERAPGESDTASINNGPKIEPDLNDVRVDAAAFDHYPLGVDSSSDSDSESDSSDTEDSLDDDSLDDSSEDSLPPAHPPHHNPDGSSSDSSSSEDSSPPSPPPHHNPTHTPNTFTSQTLTNQNFPPSAHLSHCTIKSCNIATATLIDCKITSCNIATATLTDCRLTSCNTRRCTAEDCRLT
ncbi:MAG: hypothetical protein LQ349_007945, partial [Xanthoria aureola]